MDKIYIIKAKQDNTSLYLRRNSHWKTLFEILEYSRSSENIHLGIKSKQTVASV